MDKKHLVIIGGVVLVATGGYLYYQNTLTQAAQAKFNAKFAVGTDGITYFFYNGMKYALTPAQLNYLSANNSLTLPQTADEFSRFKSGGAFNWVGFPFDKVFVYSDADTSGKAYYVQNGTKRWITSSATLQDMVSTPSLTIGANLIDLPLSVLSSLPTGANIDNITDIVQGFVQDTSGGQFLITGNSIQEFGSPASLKEWLSKNGNTSPIIISDSTVHDIPWNNTLA